MSYGRMVIMDDPKSLDLAPHEWKSERDKPREPFWGPGLPFFVAFIVSIAIAASMHEYGLMAQVGASCIGAILAGAAQAIYGRSG